MLRWSKDTLAAVTGKVQRCAQARWFKRHFGIDVPCDIAGPIMTDATYEALLKKRCGVWIEPGNPAAHRPALRLAGSQK